MVKLQQNMINLLHTGECPGACHQIHKEQDIQGNVWQGNFDQLKGDKVGETWAERLIERYFFSYLGYPLRTIRRTFQALCLFHFPLENE
jgi:hypothetical protein